MRITRVSTFTLRVPLGTRTFYSSQAAFPERKSPVLCSKLTLHRVELGR